MERLDRRCFGKIKTFKHLLQAGLLLLLIISFITSALWTTQSFAASIPLEIFPLKNYNQNVDDWLKPKDQNYKKPLVELSYQEERLKEFYNHFFSTEKDSLSPWSQQYIEKILGLLDTENKQQTPKIPSEIYNLQTQLLKDFSNEDQSGANIGYGENFRPHHKSWIEKIAANMNIEQFKSPAFASDNRGITVQNAYVRVLPTMDPHFYHFGIPGQGYPFDNLQMTDIWAGTPIYILGETKDKNWALIVSPDVTGWVQSESVARVTTDFIDQWQKKAKQNLIAITHTEAPIFNGPDRNPLFRAYVGTVFPAVASIKLNAANMEQHTHFKILVPLKNVDGKASITEGYVKKEHGSPMPLAATPQNFAKIIKTLQNRLYGWGGLYFYNDCSQELKSLYVPFGIYLARHSSAQANAGKMVDMSSKSMEERLKYLMDNGKPMMTIVYIGKHVFMYMGNFPNPNSKNHALMPMTYQNIWGLKPVDLSRRSIIGQSLLFPLLKSYPEDTRLNSPANGKNFQVIYLNEWPDK